MIAGFFFLLLLVAENASSSELQDNQQMPIIRDKEMEVEKRCNFQTIVHHLNLKNDSLKYTMSRPIINNSHHTDVSLEMKLYAIIDVKEIDQTLISYIWVYLEWKNQYVKWEPEQFCGITDITVPTAYLWMPDITIVEMTEKDKASPSPFLCINHNGTIEYRNDQVVVSTCNLHVYKFPFDIQRCNISFKSTVYSDAEIKLQPDHSNETVAGWSQEFKQLQYEWLFINMSVTKKTVQEFDFNQMVVVYTITMRRRSVLYIASFILPVFFFLVLDLASFLISDSGSGKLGFKVTILLAITVLQLLLNKILPSSSDYIPLIAIYCIGGFTLLLLSLLETILVMFLIEKDSAAQENKTDGDQSLAETCGDKQNKPNLHSCFRDMKSCRHSASVYEVSADETPSVSLSESSVTQKGSSSKLTEVPFAPEKGSDELQTGKTMALLSSKRKSGYWSRIVKTINKVFAIFYLTAFAVFLAMMVSMWSSTEN
ncbi:LOW QUALITY PROTEIN: 5-hydroxytryptamine receptor 3A-like [Archocentrus centrarchus]|uniref:LOW QUALITY PROTEIN: 5-hydroxytryptamine receptor 3A-like n=1 Tax=Archocentrus centrarchus TaxID=63155 RepID=UPI0011EA45DF|nr:LOW QUALITY PROTEIN: 5-hydroxytryptamine receptor 3A-like [Archocentrus centrarchus]